MTCGLYSALCVVYWAPLPSSNPSEGEGEVSALQHSSTFFKKRLNRHKLCMVFGKCIILQTRPKIHLTVECNDNCSLGFEEVVFASLLCTIIERSQPAPSVGCYSTLWLRRRARSQRDHFQWSVKEPDQLILSGGFWCHRVITRCDTRLLRLASTATSNDVEWCLLYNLESR